MAVSHRRSEAGYLLVEPWQHLDGGDGRFLACPAYTFEAALKRRREISDQNTRAGRPMSPREIEIIQLQNARWLIDEDGNLCDTFGHIVHIPHSPTAPEPDNEVSDFRGLLRIFGDNYYQLFSLLTKWALPIDDGGEEITQPVPTHEKAEMYAQIVG